MQATDFGNLHDPARLGALDGPEIGCVLVEREVRASVVIVAEVIRQDASQMALAENNDMVEALASHRADETVSGDTMTRACLQPVPTLASPTQNRRSICAELRPGHHSLVDGKLLAQGQVLEGELAVTADEKGKEPEQVE